MQANLICIDFYNLYPTDGLLGAPAKLLYTALYRKCILFYVVHSNIKNIFIISEYDKRKALLSLIFHYIIKYITLNLMTQE